MNSETTFIVDCDTCKAKVAATQIASDIQDDLLVHDDTHADFFIKRLHFGRCPQCKYLLVGESENFHYNVDSNSKQGWSPIVRVYPSPQKIFLAIIFLKLLKNLFKKQN